jgi:hypothetical protein
MVFVCIAVKIPSPLTRHTRPLLTSYVLVLKILVLYEQLNELSSSLQVDIAMAPVASSLASKLHSWVKIDDSFTTGGKIVICPTFMFHEITFGVTCTKRATYKEQATEFIEEQVLLTQMQ